MNPTSWIWDKLAPVPGAFPSLDGPIFLLGSAPDPTPPIGAPEDWNLVTVNGSQITAAAWGMEPTLTLFGLTFLRTTTANREARKVLVGLSTTDLLCVGDPRHYFQYKFITWRLRYRYERLTILTPQERDKITKSVIGSDRGTSCKPSNGIFLALLCLHLGASCVVMSGFSLNSIRACLQQEKLGANACRS